MDYKLNWTRVTDFFNRAYRFYRVEIFESEADKIRFIKVATKEIPLGVDIDEIASIDYLLEESVTAPYLSEDKGFEPKEQAQVPLSDLGEDSAVGENFPTKNLLITQALS